MGLAPKSFGHLCMSHGNNIQNQHSLISSNNTKCRLPFEVTVYLIKPGLLKAKICNVPATSTNPG